ncbi:response regulator [Arcobacter lacus]|nr:response regulator [Arcobacter lacus]
MNLLGNSLKFTKKGFVSLCIYELKNKLFFEVKDSGIGISKKYQEKIFKPFEQIKKDNYTVEGTGLGLSITKELINLMGGDIYLKSKVDVGSEFYFSINYNKSNQNEIQNIALKNIVGIENQNFLKTVLIVDDIKENRELMVQLLNFYGIKTVQASSGFQALQIFEKEKLDLIFMDILMEGMDGKETILNIRKIKEGKNIPIIALSANVFIEDKNDVLNSGANDFLAKPVEEKEIFLILQKYLNIELLYENKINTEKIDIEKELENIPKEFFKKLKEKAFLMDNDGILNLLKDYNLSQEFEIYVNSLINEFKYQELIDFYKE